MADRHTPVVAITSGTIISVDSQDNPGELGGRTIWLSSDEGVEFYYAHLESIDPGISEGERVQVGDPLGGVGTSGNARSTPPHLHLEIRPGGTAVDPYPTLAQVCGGAR